MSTITDLGCMCDHRTWVLAGQRITRTG